MGRTGRWWAIEHFRRRAGHRDHRQGHRLGHADRRLHRPRSVWTWPPGAHGSTFAGNPVCAAAALATLDVIEAEGLANAEAMGSRLRDGLERVAERTRCATSAGPG